MGLGSLFCMSYRPESYLEEYFPFPPFPFHFRIREGYFENLSISHEIGRVAVVENLSSGNLDEYLARLSEEKDRQIAEVDNRYEQAMAIMRG